jgi:hypothetical protein
MRLLLLSAAVLTLTTASFEAEARARFRVGAPRVSRQTTVQGVFIAAPARPTSAGDRAPTIEDHQNPSREPAPMLEAAIVAAAPGIEPSRDALASAPAAPKASPQPVWCATGRVAGTGKGFCLVN